MIDIHNHILPGVDDGAENAKETARMIAMAVNEGMDAVVATSHVEAGMGIGYIQKYARAYDKVRKYIASRDIPLRLYYGQELFYSEGIIEALQREEVLTMNDTNYVLVEFPVFESYQYIERALHRFKNAGYWPILAHVERYRSLRDMKLIKQLKDQGAYIQVNASAVMGKAGLGTRIYCASLLRKQYVDFIATDAHGCKHRRPLLKDCYTHVEHKYGKEYCRLIMDVNPRKVLEGEKICGED